MSLRPGAQSPSPWANNASAQPQDENTRPPPPKERLLSAAEVGMVNKRAQINATITGIGTAIVCGLVSRRMFNFSPNSAVVAAIGSGSFIAYIESRTELARGMAALNYAHEMRTGAKPSGIRDDQDEFELRAASEPRFDAGVGGMHEFVDRGATTRGDH